MAEMGEAGVDGRMYGHGRPSGGGFWLLPRLEPDAGLSRDRPADCAGCRTRLGWRIIHQLSAQCRLGRRCPLVVARIGILSPSAETLRYRVEWISVLHCL